MARFIFTRTMAQVADALGEVTFRFMVCVRRELSPEQLEQLMHWVNVHRGAGMFAQTWRLVVTRQICVSCSS
jgi:hypothetical protein